MKKMLSHNIIPAAFILLFAYTAISKLSNWLLFDYVLSKVPITKPLDILINDVKMR